MTDVIGAQFEILWSCPSVRHPNAQTRVAAVSRGSVEVARETFMMACLAALLIRKDESPS
jgi:hypothetical protein